MKASFKAPNNKKKSKYLKTIIKITKKEGAVVVKSEKMSRYVTIKMIDYSSYYHFNFSHNLEFYVNPAIPTIALLFLYFTTA